MSLILIAQLVHSVQYDDMIYHSSCFR